MEPNKTGSENHAKYDDSRNGATANDLGHQ
jgi:hypothetical protein